MFLPGESDGWRSLGGYSPWGCKDSDTTEQLSIAQQTVTSYGFMGSLMGMKEKTQCVAHNLARGLLEFAKSWGTKHPLLCAFVFPVVKWMVSILQTVLFLLFKFLLQYRCITMFYYFLWFSKVNQSYIYIYPSGWISFSFRSQQSTD